MTKRTKVGTPAELEPEAVLKRYGRWLARQPLADRTSDAYIAQVTGFVTWLASSGYRAQALTEPRERDLAVRGYKRHLKTKKKWAPTSVNQGLAAIDNFYRSISMGRPEVAREELAQVAPRALEEDDQRAFLRAVERSPSARDRAIATVYTGLRLSELAALETADVSVSARRGRLRVRSGKGDACRDVPLYSACRAAIDEWMVVRARQLSKLAVIEGVEGEMNALWLSRTGGRMTLGRSTW